MLNVVVFDKGSPIGAALKHTAEQMGVAVHLITPDDQNISSQVSSVADEIRGSIDYLILLLGQGGNEDNLLSEDWLVEFEQFAANEKIPVIVQSSAAVFSGEPGFSFTELALPNPSSKFGKYCWSVEQQFAQLEKFLVIRTGWLFSERPSDWFAKIIYDVENGNLIDFPADQVGQPTSCGDFSRILVAVLEQLNCADDPEIWATYHYASADQVSKNKFCQTIMNEMANYSDVSESVLDSTPYSQCNITGDFSQNSVLDCTRILSVFGIKQRAWKKEVSAIIAKKFAELEQ